MNFVYQSNCQMAFCSRKYYREVDVCGIEFSSDFINDRIVLNLRSVDGKFMELKLKCSNIKVSYVKSSNCTAMMISRRKHFVNFSFQSNAEFATFDGKFCKLQMEYVKYCKMEKSRYESAKIPRNWILKKMYSNNLFKQIYNKYNQPECSVNFDGESGKSRDLNIKDKITIRQRFQRKRIDLALKTTQGDSCYLTIKCADLDVINPSVFNVHYVVVKSELKFYLFTFKCIKERNAFSAQLRDVQDGYDAYRIHKRRIFNNIPIK